MGTGAGDAGRRPAARASSADAIGKYKMFAIGSVLGAAIVAIYCNLGTTPLATVMAINAVLFVAITCRMISAQRADLGGARPARTGAPSCRSTRRCSSSRAGSPSSVAGLIVVQAPDGRLPALRRARLGGGGRDDADDRAHVPDQPRGDAEGGAAARRRRSRRPRQLRRPSREAGGGRASSRLQVGCADAQASLFGSGHGGPRSAFPSRPRALASRAARPSGHPRSPGRT